MTKLYGILYTMTSMTGYVIFLLGHIYPNMNIYISEYEMRITETHSGCVTYCHNPTNNPKQLKTTFVGVVL